MHVCGIENTELCERVMPTLRKKKKKRIENGQVSSPVAPGWCRCLWTRAVSGSSSSASLGSCDLCEAVNETKADFAHRPRPPWNLIKKRGLDEHVRIRVHVRANIARETFGRRKKPH